MNVARTALAITAAVFTGGLASGQTTTRVSVDSGGAEADSYSGGQSATATSADGRFVAFNSYATNLVASDTNSDSDVFVHDRITGATVRVSIDSAGVEGNAWSTWPSLSSNGRFVAFASAATNLVPSDTNASVDVFVHDRDPDGNGIFDEGNGLTTRISLDSNGLEGDGFSYAPSISAGGLLVAFVSDSTNLVLNDTNWARDVFVRDLFAGTTERVSVDSAGIEGNGYSDLPTISADGVSVAFESRASNLVAGDGNGFDDIFVHDRATGVTERVSVDSLGAEANDNCLGPPAVSADGDVVAFYSDAYNLVAGDSGNSVDVFVHVRSTGTTERVTVDSSGNEGDRSSFNPALSADGRIAVFQSDARNLIASDTNKTPDVFAHDRQTGVTERLSVDSAGAESNGFSWWPSVSGDGQVVAFFSDATNLVSGDANGFTDVFAHERCLIDASWSNYGAGYPGGAGVPSFTAQANPVLGSSLTLDLGNSSGKFTAAVIFVGFQQATLHSSWGGDLLLIPAVTSLIGLPPSGISLTGQLPSDDSLCGFVVDLQAIEADAGATKGVSFTPGLQLILGR